MSRGAGLMIQGTTSDAGKSLLVTGLCRALYRRGVRVAPFKPQNMALNSAVTEDGGEIGRAQAVQAQACALAPHTDMNPVLLKPNSDIGAQIIVHGKAMANMEADAYHRFKPQLLDAVLASYERLLNHHEAVIVEGAGSPAEINLRDRDIANMGFAQAADCPVLLAGDIDRGGVFAQFVGTLALLSPSERERVRGFIVNRFRGDPALLKPGLDWLVERTGKPVFGVVPFIPGLHLEAEDSIACAQTAKTGEPLRVVVPALPRISNHTDFDPLRLHPQVDLQFGGPGAQIPAADLIILPGSKSVRADLQWLHDHGWVDAVQRHLRYHGKLLGICGGFQMLGRLIRDPHGVEGPAGTSRGLGFLDMETRLLQTKHLRQVTGTLAWQAAGVSGYEIHAGICEGPALSKPMVHLAGRTDGAVSDDEQIAGTYLHGLFEHPDACAAVLRWAGIDAPHSCDYGALREAGIDRVADAMEQHVAMDAVMDILGAGASAHTVHQPL